MSYKDIQTEEIERELNRAVREFAEGKVANLTFPLNVTSVVVRVYNETAYSGTTNINIHADAVFTTAHLVEWSINCSTKRLLDIEYTKNCTSVVAENIARSLVKQSKDQYADTVEIHSLQNKYFERVLRPRNLRRCW